MPMRRSDDYLTARAANPRTGMISPSVAGTPNTPESPGQALRLVQLNTQGTPTPQNDSMVQTRQTAKLCGVGTKSAQSVMWLRDGSCWLQDTRALKMALPIITTSEDADLLDASHHPGFKDDDFVVKMPSAREPQPYRFPGSSGAQIKAFEHYKHKAKRTSVEGYDPRLIELYEDGPMDNQAVHSVSPPRSGMVRTHRVPVNQVSHMAMHHQTSHPRQHQLPKQRHHEPAPFHELADIADVSQPATRKSSVETNVTAIHHPTNATASSGIPAADSQQARPNLRRTSNESAASQATVITSRAPAHLGQLPRVRLVHPSLAGMPPSHNVPASRDASFAGIPSSHSVPVSRKCSLGCDQTGDGTACLSPSKDPRPVFEPSLCSMLKQTTDSQTDDVAAPSLTTFMESVALTFTILWQVVQSSIASHEHAIPQLFPQDLTLWEKLMVVKSMVLLLAKATAILMIIAVMWKIADVAMQMVRFLFTPLRFLMGLNR